MDEVTGSILLVDDDPVIGQFVHQVLCEAGYLVTVCWTLEDAVQLLACHAVDLVVTDGFSRTPAEVFAATAALRQAAGRTPVALFTGHTIHPDAAAEAGFAAVLAKPFDLDEFEAQIATLVSGAVETRDDGSLAPDSSEHSHTPTLLGPVSPR